jgi:hypothetical protein
MGQVDVANQLRASYTVHFQRNLKEFFPGMFWLIDLVCTNTWKIFQSLNSNFLNFTTGNKDPRSHRHFLEILVDLIFQCTDEQYPERVPQPPTYSPFNYPRWNYIPREKRKAIEGLLQPIRGIQGRPIQRVPTSFTPLVNHKHIPTTTRGHCVICRNTEKPKQHEEIEKSILPGTSIISFTAEKSREQETNTAFTERKPRGANTAWKCSECL